MSMHRGIRLTWVAGIAVALLAAPALSSPAMGMQMSQGMQASMGQAPCCSDDQTGHNSTTRQDHCCVACPAAGFVMPLTVMTVLRLPLSATSISTTADPLVPHAAGPPPTPPPKR
ncbi:MAG: hypothetical protein L0I62_03340 [Gammaproteobacteria bacterium]|nr:hypothetical protein [Gammaproteobacteria bacterium]